MKYKIQDKEKLEKYKSWKKEQKKKKREKVGKLNIIGCGFLITIIIGLIISLFIFAIG
ncbi:MAG: hypothetical protein ACFFA6_12375 [Promethearchaeota archaeon]